MKMIPCPETEFLANFKSALEEVAPWKKTELSNGSTEYKLPIKDAVMQVNAQGITFCGKGKTFTTGWEKCFPLSNFGAVLTSFLTTVYREG